MSLRLIKVPVLCVVPSLAMAGGRDVIARAFIKMFVTLLIGLCACLWKNMMSICIEFQIFDYEKLCRERNTLT